MGPELFMINAYHYTKSFFIPMLVYMKCISDFKRREYMYENCFLIDFLYTSDCYI